jgi:hypothetical protein
VPPSNIPLLQDFKAGRADLDEVLSNWPPLHTAEQAVVLVYCSGQARVAPSGDILLVPHDDRTATAHLYPLKNMESALAKLKTKQILFIFDSLVTQPPPKPTPSPTSDIDLLVKMDRGHSLLD